MDLLQRLQNHRAIMAPHQKEREAGKLLIEAIGEIEALRAENKLCTEQLQSEQDLLRRAGLALDRLNVALKAADWVFDELDQAKWPKSEADEYYGKAGKCPVDYDEAQALIKGVLYPPI